MCTKMIQCVYLQIYAETRDDNFELVIVDYESEDMDIEEKLKASSVNRLVIRMES